MLFEDFIITTLKNITMLHGLFFYKYKYQFHLRLQERLSRGKQRKYKSVWAGKSTQQKSLRLN